MRPEVHRLLPQMVYDSLVRASAAAPPARRKGGAASLARWPRCPCRADLAGVLPTGILSLNQMSGARLRCPDLHGGQIMTSSFDIPAMGFGTFDRRGEAGITAIGYALELGYRHLDTAQSYETEAECGEALRRSGLKRSDVFLTTKVSGPNSVAGQLLPSLEESAANLGVGAIDLTLIHWPVTSAGRLDMRAYLTELAEAQARGLTRLIGVSNFTIADLEEAKTGLGPGVLANHQFERHPFLQNQKLVNYCQYNGISVTCYLLPAAGAWPLRRRPGDRADRCSPRRHAAPDRARLLAEPGSHRHPDLVQARADQGKFRGQGHRPVGR